MYCKNCGAALPDNAKFCTNCAAPIAHLYKLNVSDVIKFGTFSLVLWFIQLLCTSLFLPSIIYEYGTAAASAFQGARAVFRGISFVAVPIGIGAALLVQKRMVDGNLAKMSKLLRKLLLLTILLSVLEFLVVLFLPYSFFDTLVPAEVNDLARYALIYLSLGLLFTNTTLVFNTVIYQDGHPLTALGYAIIDVLLVQVAARITPSDLGVSGRFLFSSIAHIVAFCMVIYYFTLKPNTKLRLIKRH